MKQLLISALLLFLAASARAQQSCTDLANLHSPGFALTVTKTQQLPADKAIGAYCRVDGYLDPRTGLDGLHYQIGFALALPANWNGRFLFQGGGALNGVVRDPLGNNASGDVPALSQGFAVVTTDSGHTASPFDPTFFRDQEASLNFSYGAIGKVTALAKQIVAQFYGRPAHHSYFDGCSTGGREAMLVTQRYPEEFDGVIAGAPAMHTGFSGIGDRFVAVTLNQAAPKDKSGHATGAAFSPAEKKLVIASLLDQCDALDGLRDGMIFNQQSCHFYPGPLDCKSAKTESNPDSCLSKPQIDALNKALAGPKDTRGNPVYPGFFYDTGIVATEGIPGILSFGPNPFGPAVTATTIDIDALADAARSDPRAALTDTPSTNLTTFSGRGGKLLFYHGVSDPWFSAKDTVAYYERMANANGGMNPVQAWSRLFLVPGMGHCGGGEATLDNFDLLTAITDWVEKGIAPDSVLATGKSLPNRSRPLCPYPKHTQYNGHGDPESAQNFSCVE